MVDKMVRKLVTEAMLLDLGYVTWSWWNARYFLCLFLQYSCKYYIHTHTHTYIWHTFAFQLCLAVCEDIFMGKAVFICLVNSVNSVLKFLGQPGETRFQPGGDETSSGVPMIFNTKLTEPKGKSRLLFLWICTCIHKHTQEYLYLVRENVKGWCWFL